MRRDEFGVACDNVRLYGKTGLGDLRVLSYAVRDETLEWLRLEQREELHEGPEEKTKINAAYMVTKGVQHKTPERRS